MRKKLGNTADYIIPAAVVVGGVWAISKLVNWIGDLPAVATLQPSTPAEVQAPANITSMQWLSNYASNRGQDCFTSALYKANPGNVLIGVGDAADLYHLVRNQAGTWFSSGDMTGILDAFQKVVDNQTDMSYVASLFETNTGKDMFQYMDQSSIFANGLNPAGDNMQQLVAFFQWALSLPVTGQQQ